MKKVAGITLICMLVVALTGTVVFAAPLQSGPNGWYCPYWGQQQTNLTDEQKQELASYQQQMIEVKRQELQKQVEWGWISQAQADYYIESMKQHAVDGPMYGHGMMGGRGMMGIRGQGIGCW